MGISAGYSLRGSLGQPRGEPQAGGVAGQRAHGEPHTPLRGSRHLVSFWLTHSDDHRCARADFHPLTGSLGRGEERRGARGELCRCACTVRGSSGEGRGLDHGDLSLFDVIDPVRRRVASAGLRKQGGGCKLWPPLRPGNDRTTGPRKHHWRLLFFVGEFSGVSGRGRSGVGREGLEALPAK